MTTAVKTHLQAEEPQKIVAAAASVLSSLSSFAGVVTAPRRSHMFKQIEFMRLSDKRILLIIVTPEGDVQNRIMATQRDYSPSQLSRRRNYINAHFAGLVLRRSAPPTSRGNRPVARRHDHADARSGAASTDETDPGDDAS